jgi:hypothetical protein
VCVIVIAYYFIGSTSVKRILSSRIYNAKAMDEKPNPFEADRPTVAEGLFRSTEVITHKPGRMPFPNIDHSSIEGNPHPPKGKDREMLEGR